MEIIFVVCTIKDGEVSSISYPLEDLCMDIQGSPIPRQGETVILDNIPYEVKTVTYDYDKKYININIDQV